MHTERRYSLFDSQNFQTVPRSTETVHSFDNGYLYVGEDVLSRVPATINTPPAELRQQAAYALLLAEYIEERQSAVQAEKEAEKAAQEAQVEKEAQALFESVGGVDWHYTVTPGKADYIKMARKAREIHGVRK